MKVTILHGGNTQAKLRKLDELTAGFEGLVVRASGKEITNEFCLNNFGSAGLFGEKKMIVLTDPAEEWMVDEMPENENVELVLVYEKELGVRSKVLAQERVKSGKVYNFTAPQDRRIWELLEMVLEGNPKMVGRIIELTEELGGQYILSMLEYNWRRLIVPGNSPDFVKRKMKNVREKLGLEGVARRYQECLETDWKIKKGMGSEKDLIGLLAVNWLK